jgi:hypothetical protein
MGSFLRPKTAFSESDLSELEWVLEGCFRALGSPDDETKAILRRRFVLACSGVIDPDELRDMLVASARQMMTAPASASVSWVLSTASSRLDHPNQRHGFVGEMQTSPRPRALRKGEA